MGKILLTMTALFIATSANAAERTVQAGYDSSAREVQLLIEDVQVSTRACDYHVAKMSYDKNRRVLGLTLAEEPCFTDVVAKKRAMFKWNMPRSLHMNSFCLRVDNRYLGRVTFESASVTVNPSCN
ncbi:MAG: hypothetical protein ABL958_07300 [Bdellovibrionia bacterium]